MAKLNFKISAVSGTSSQLKNHEDFVQITLMEFAHLTRKPPSREMMKRRIS